MAQRTSGSVMMSSSSPSSRRRITHGGPGVSRGGAGVSVVDFSLSEAINAEFRTTRSDEKAQMQHLNDRFATYIDTVRTLEQQNRALAAELERPGRWASKAGAAPGSATCTAMEELRRCAAGLEQLTRDKAQVEVERDNLADDTERLRLKLQEEMLQKEDAEHNLQTFRQERTQIWWLSRTDGRGRRRSNEVLSQLRVGSGTKSETMLESRPMVDHSKRVVIKTIETRDGQVINESTQQTDEEE
ncbi:hypothetical protein CRUP_025758 [Coryphaenoides rupestris]|nr:hypothetical protein CRUP_025758 [Coryphaenoides rupestris]